MPLLLFKRLFSTGYTIALNVIQSYVTNSSSKISQIIFIQRIQNSPEAVNCNHFQSQFREISFTPSVITVESISLSIT